jgi:hypothetical protein
MPPERETLPYSWKRKMWIPYNPNPAGHSTIDCTVRALSKALDTDWDTAYLYLVSAGYELKLMPSTNSLWGYVLREHGFKRNVVPSTCPYCYTAEDFCRDHPKGTYVLVFGDHVCTATDGDIYDSWDSSREIVQYYWEEM